MAKTVCKCCGKTIERGALTDLQLASIDALNAASDAYDAARDTELRRNFETASTTLIRVLDLVSVIKAQATPEQQVAFHEAADHVASKLRKVGPS